MSNSSSSDDEVLRLAEISQDIRASYIWVVFVLGFPTNLFSILTVLTMRTLTPATFYVSVLALCDCLTLLTKLVGHQMSMHGAYFGSIGCKADFVSGYISAVANWMLVFICAERCVSVCLPLKRNIIFTKRRAYVSTIVLGVSLFVFYAAIYCLMRDSTDDGLYCGTRNEYLAFWVTGWYWIDVSTHVLLPLPIIVILTILIIRAISISRQDRRCILHNGSNGHDDGNSRLLKETERLERNITIMLVLAAVIFMILCLPMCVFLLAYRKSSDRLTQARWMLFDQIQYLCVDTSHAINFFLYFLSSKKFRDQFIYLITCHRWPKRLRKTTNPTSMSSSYTTKYTIAKSTEDVSHI